MLIHLHTGREVQHLCSVAVCEHVIDSLAGVDSVSSHASCDRIPPPASPRHKRYTSARIRVRRSHSYASCGTVRMDRVAGAVLVVVCWFTGPHPC